MRKFLIPSGIVYFPGSYVDLLHVVGGIYGTLDDENVFHCKLSFPRRNYTKFSFVRVRGRTSFLFRCTIERREDSCKIAYKVYPTFSSALILLLAVYMLFYGLQDAKSQDFLGNICAGLFAGALLIGLFLLARRSCIRQFVQKFEGEDESNFC